MTVLKILLPCGHKTHKTSKTIFDPTERGILDCLIYEMLYIRNMKQKFNT